MSREFHPIASLNPYQNRWTIKARVTAKGDVRTFSNSKGDGKLFSVDLLDKDGGAIKATMFNEAVDKFEPMFELEKVYIISRGMLKLANKRFNVTKNDYELTLNADAEVEFVGEDKEIEQQRFDFCSIDKIEGVAADEYVDIVGMVTAVTPMSSITSKVNQREMIKRTLTLCDKSLVSVDVTMWGTQAEKHTEEMLLQQVIAIKSCRVSDFGGKSLNTTFGSQIFLNPENREETTVLREWYDSVGKESTVESLSKKMVGSGLSRDPRKCFKDVTDEKLGFQEKPDYFVVKGTVTYYRSGDFEKPPWYNACPAENCNKKVTLNDASGLWQCEKCDKGFPAPSPRYILSLLCCDATGMSWMTAFDNVAQQLLKTSAKEVDNIKKEGSQEKFDAVFKKALFQTFLFKIRAKAELRDDQMRQRAHIISASPLNFKEESQNLLDQIAAY